MGGLKFLPFTEVSLGNQKGKAQPLTGSVILRYLNEEAANAAVERLKGHPIQTSAGESKHLGAKHATPPKWAVERKREEDQEKKAQVQRGETLQQKITGYVVRVSMAGYGVIKSAEYGEVMWRQYELPTNLRTLQLTNKPKFVKEVEQREDYLRLKQMDGKEVEAELYKQGDGQLRASHVRAKIPPEMLQEGAGYEPPPVMPPIPGGPPGPDGMPPPGMMGKGMPPFPFDPAKGGMKGGPPPFMDPAYQAQMMQAMQAMQAARKEKKA